MRILWFGFAFILLWHRLMYLLEKKHFFDEQFEVTRLTVDKLRSLVGADPNIFPKFTIAFLFLLI